MEIRAQTPPLALVGAVFADGLRAVCTAHLRPLLARLNPPPILALRESRQAENPARPAAVGMSRTLARFYANPRRQFRGCLRVEIPYPPRGI